MRKAVILLLALGSIQAQANDSKDVSGFYLGGGIGNTTYTMMTHSHSSMVTVQPLNLSEGISSIVSLVLKHNTQIMVLLSLSTPR